MKCCPRKWTKILWLTGVSSWSFWCSSQSTLAADVGKDAPIVIVTSEPPGSTPQSLSSAGSATPIIPRDPLIAELLTLFQKGDYDTIIEKASARIEAVKADDKLKDSVAPNASQGSDGPRDTAVERLKLPPELFYLRGRSAFKVGYYRMAESDLAPLMNVKLNPRWIPASQIVTKIRALKTIIPPSTHEVRHDGKVVFRVYYPADDEFTRGIVQLLPEAYRVNHEMLGVHISETPVFIFKKYEDFRECYRLLSVSGRPPGTWISAAGTIGAFYFSHFNSHGQQITINPRSAKSRSLVAHEFNHCMVLRMTGGLIPPHWMSEGLAEVVGSRLAPETIALNDRKIAQLFAAGKILSFADLNKFSAIIEENSDAKRQGLLVPDPYAQGFHMTRFLLRSIESGALPKLLTGWRESRDFSKTFQKYTGKTTEEFYNAWLQTLEQKNRETVGIADSAK